MKRLVFGIMVMALFVSCEEELFDELVADRIEEASLQGEQLGETAEDESENGSGGEETGEGSSEGNMDDDSTENEDNQGDSGDAEDGDPDEGEGQEDESEDDGADGEDGTDSEESTDNDESLTDINTINAVIADGIWNIVSYRQNNSFGNPRDFTDTTSDFDNYTFDFDVDGTVEININGSTIVEAWSLTKDNNNEIIFNLNTSNNDSILNSLNKEWMAVSFGHNDFEFLTGERNGDARTDNRIFLAFEKL